MKKKVDEEEEEEKEKKQKQITFAYLFEKSMLIPFLLFSLL
jgi:hypothetical protein